MSADEPGETVDFGSALKRVKAIASELRGSSGKDAGAPPSKILAGDVALKDELERAQKLAESLAKRAFNHADYDAALGLNITDTLLVPNYLVGLVIGKGGEQIRLFQEKAGCKMFVIQDGEYAKGPEKLVTFQGSQHTVSVGKQLVLEFMGEKEQMLSIPPGSLKAEVAVPQDSVGLIIGKGGDNIKKLHAETGCRVSFNPGEKLPGGDRICIFEGLPQSIFFAQLRVREIVENVVRKNGGIINQVMLPEGCDLVEIPVTSYKCPAIIGKDGEILQAIMDESGAHIDVNKAAIDNGDTKQFLIAGTEEQISRARELMVKKVGLTHVRRTQAPTNVQVTIVPQGSDWHQAAAERSIFDATYMPNVTAIETAAQQPAVGMPSEPDISYMAPQAEGPELTSEEYASAWATYYEQCRAFADDAKKRAQEAGDQAAVESYEKYIEQLEEYSKAQQNAEVKTDVMEDGNEQLKEDVTEQVKEET